ncbi:MAG: hypothetical protein JNL01_09105 [Bdellovibrionales bacterium]|nr:hypothetical protein [Bdellovibrionales bacterium]
MNRKKADLDEILEKVTQLVKEKPDLAARVLDEWMKKPTGRAKTPPSSTKNPTGHRVEDRLGIPTSKKKKIA